MQCTLLIKSLWSFISTGIHLQTHDHPHKKWTSGFLMALCGFEHGHLFTIKQSKAVGEKADLSVKGTEGKADSHRSRGDSKIKSFPETEQVRL